MRGADGGRRDVEAILREARDDAVVHDEARLVQHQAVAAAPDAELGEGIDVEPVEEFAGVGADDLDLAERGGVHHAGALARAEAFARHRRRQHPRPGCLK